ncbi:Pkinase-domain-containing protein [Hesseltinella vesiculosa]|uniref:Pkinase-domain-containing protein n=1 Tax=Hesseltinella vesiculosa TaxID=101127 RepID=A0A1X2GTQ5_9FUNG|nr:Pkinase-domain-containing protein [Hesseltinella vesiculosa]
MASQHLDESQMESYGTPTTQLAPPSSPTKTSPFPLLTPDRANGNPSNFTSEYNMIRQYIPERKSSSPDHIARIMKNFQVPTGPLNRRANPITTRRTNGAFALPNPPPAPPTVSPSPSSSGPLSRKADGGWKISRGKVVTKSKSKDMLIASVPSTPSSATIPPLPQVALLPQSTPSPSREQRIQVTLDSDIFRSLTVTNIHDPVELKRSIVTKVGMPITPLDQYQFYHENGDDPDTPLEDKQLVFICGHSDNSKHRILVKSSLPLSAVPPPVSPQHPPVSLSSALWAIPPQPLRDDSPEKSPPSAPPVAALWAVPPQKSSSFAQAPQPPQLTPPQSAPVLSPIDQSKPISVSLWAVPPQSVTNGSITPVSPSTPISAPLWAVPPRPMNPPPHHDTTFSSVTTPSFASRSDIDATADHLMSAALWQVPPKPSSLTPPTMVTSRSSSTLSPIGSATTPTPTITTTAITSSLTASTSTPTIVTTGTMAATSPSPGPWPAAAPYGSPYYHRHHGANGAITPSSSSSVSSPLQSYVNRDGSGTTETELMQAGLTAVRLEDPPVSLSASSSNESNGPVLRPALVHPGQHRPGNRTTKHLYIQIPNRHANDESPQPSPQHMPPLSTSLSNSTSNGNSLSPSITTNVHWKTASSTSATALRTPLSSSDNGSPTFSPSHELLTDTEIEDNWAERPSIERLYRDIDKYLPGHDLDKEIMLDDQAGTSTTPAVAAAPTPPPLTRKLQGHKKSIRVVANEAHRNWKQAVNVIRVNNILRRRSTKMWGHRVQQVKPGSLPEEREDTSTVLPDGTPAPTKLQWMRGELIGKGSYGRVYHALNVAAGEWIAVKQVDIPTTAADRLNKSLNDTQDALYREISLLKDLEHENIVQYLGYDVDKEEGYINIFLEYVPGGSIATCLNRQGKFDEGLTSFFTRQILLGLEYLHDRNILHRDIKAGNVLLNHQGACKITDFGLSKLSGQDKAYDPHGSNSLMRGTVYWMAPEMVSGTNYSAKVDIWSLGCTVIEMLTGKHPWLDLNIVAALYNLGQFEAPPLPEDISDLAKSFLKECFQINPEERPTAAELLVHPFVAQNPSFKFKDYMENLA